MKKPALAQIQKPLLFDSVTLARIAQINPMIIYSMKAGEPVTRWQAESVLNALSWLTERNYTLNTVHDFDKDKIQKKRLPYERLDQLTVDIIAGVR